MRSFQHIFIVFFLFCSIRSSSQVIFEHKDKEILDQVFNRLKNDNNKPTAELVVLAGKVLKETPYVAHTLEKEPEQLVINLRGLDCTTFTENCLAIARSVKSGKPTFKNFTKELCDIRYREGKVDGYLSRLHYFSDWIYENDTKGLVKRISKDIAHTHYPLNVNFMSTHPDSYKQLKRDSDLTPILDKKEKEISTRKMFYIPKYKVPNFEPKLQEGDIVGITTSIKGLDIMHVGIVVKKNGRVHLMHASSKAEKVIISRNTLYKFLIGRESVTGIMVVRPM